MRTLFQPTRTTVFSVVFLTLSATQARAADFEYPELQVTPRASDRLQMEATSEPSSQWTTHMSVQIPALATLITGLTNDISTPQGAIAAGFGAGWLAVTLFLNATYRPYEAGVKTIS